jgi:hypothetical protein
VDDVLPNKKRDFQPGLLHGNLLYLIDDLEFFNVEDGAHSSFGDLLLELGGDGWLVVCELL